MTREIVKQVKNAILYNDGCIRIDNVRASYPHLSKPWAKDDAGTPKFSITGIGEKKTHDEVKNLCVEVINKLVKDQNLGTIGAQHKFCRNGDDSGKPENEDCWLFVASERAERRPAVRTRTGSVAATEEIDDLVYAGCYVNILIRPWAQNNQYGKKINANLVAVQFARDGERFGEAPISDDDVWDAVEDDEGGL